MKQSSIKKSIVIISIVVVTIVLSLVITLIAIMSNGSYIKLDVNKLNDINNTLTVVDKSGNNISQPMYIGNGKYVALEDIPQHVIDAFVSIEDKRFWTHKGTDNYRLVGATLHNIKSRSFKEGASTITQQLIKNTHLDNNKTIKRKINEMHLARQLERKFDKRKILEMYLNTIYFGNNSYGIENACNTYFDKSVSQLTISEGAVLAGLIKAPNSYSPITNLDKCLQRRNVVLKVMLEQEKISPAQYAECNNSSLQVNAANTTQCRTYMYGVIDEACKILNMSPIQLLNSRFKISTYYNPSCQEALQQSVQKDNTLQSNDKQSNVCAIACDNATGGITAMYIRGIGNIDKQSRQIGSTAKPIAVYAPAIDTNQLTSSSCILDEPCNYGDYCPSNYNNKYYGWCTATTALSKSLNASAVKTLNTIGVENATSYLRKMGINTQQHQNLSLALGNIEGGMNSYQLLQCYSALANNGKFNKSTYIKAIANDKAILYQNNPENTVVYKESTAYIITNMLQDATKHGTAKKLASLRFDLACKTGTVGDCNGNTDAIACAYTADSTFSVWISGELSNKITGGSAPCAILYDAMKDYYKRNTPKKFAIPDTVVILPIDSVTLSSKQLSVIVNDNIKKDEIIYFPFAKDNAPYQYSSRGMEPTNAVLDVITQSDKVIINIPQDGLQYKIYKIVDNIEIELSHDGKICCDRDIDVGIQFTYYAVGYKDNQIISQSQKHTVVLQDQSNHNEPPTDDRNEAFSLSDILYWKR